ncbi:hypothetical protein JTE90_008516 [Oedothorax gibbosus]|uniref:ornithine decarboxylase n=1 Tax=Oedothorax gibbosus TaxID=931172 RepID=A0AAV6VH15_9ARAC|nr:hypothetical protein JTE90_008516 [Oedothorax gibbosus]
MGQFRLFVIFPEQTLYLRKAVSKQFRIDTEQNSPSMAAAIRNEALIKSMLHELELKDELEPFFVADIGDVVLKWKEWTEAMPRVEPFYAVKCNPDRVLLRVMASLGVNFDCSSKREMELALEAGVSPRRILYANTCKGPAHLAYAQSVGVDLMTFDNEEELHKIKRRFPTAKLVIRLKVDDSGAILKLSLKFGAEMAEVPHLLDVAKKLHLNVVGVSFHVGCNCQDPLAFAKAIKCAKDVFDLAKQRGSHMNLLDIGGGFPGHRGHVIAFQAFASAINGSLNDFFPPDTGVRIIAEPGRYFMTSAFTLLTNIIGKREALDENKCKNTMYFINEGVYGSFNNLIYHNTKFVPTALNEPSKNCRMEPSSIWGPTCDSVDRVWAKCLLPRMRVGDWLAFENMGSYTLACASNFNGFDITGVKYLLSQPLLKFFQNLPAWPALQTTFAAEHIVDVKASYLSYKAPILKNG